MVEAIIYLLAIIIAELVAVFIQPMWGVGCHFVILTTVIVHSAVSNKRLYQKLFLSLALVPIIRITSLSMPLTDIPQIWWFVIISIPLFAATITVMRILGYSVGEVGISFRMLPMQLAVALTGLLFGLVEYSILSPDAMIAELTWQELWLPALILLVCTGFLEEFIFRGVIQRSATEVFGWWGILYVSLIFAFLHVGFLSWLDVIFVFFVSLFFGWVAKRTGSILGVAIAHGVTNIVLYLIAFHLLG